MSWKTDATVAPHDEYARLDAIQEAMRKVEPQGTRPSTLWPRRF